jgi:AraC-like DNA-binding protein
MSRLFKDETGTNLTAYIRDRRMDRARELLTSEPELAVGEIAVRCGYPDVNYFSYSFRATVEVSPSTYRVHSIAGRSASAPGEARVD